LSNATDVEGKHVKAYLSFPKNASNKIEFRYAISYISPEQARKNIEEEIKNKPFSELKAEGEKAWGDIIGKINVEGGLTQMCFDFIESFEYA
jgi:putative alpha-1,2-mannosidase